MKALKIFCAMLMFVVFVAAAPSTSPYGKIPKKKGKLETSDGVQTLREDTVSPEEVYKHGVQEISVIATDTGFHPSKVYVRKNIPVHLFLTSASPAKLCFIMDDFQIRKGVSIQQVDQVNFLPTKVGEYKFYCPVSEIKGSLIVRD